PPPGRSPGSRSTPTRSSSRPSRGLFRVHRGGRERVLGTNPRPASSLAGVATLASEDYLLEVEGSRHPADDLEVTHEEGLEPAHSSPASAPPRAPEDGGARPAAQCAAAASSAAFPFGFLSRNTSSRERANSPASTRKPELNARVSACESRREA